MMRGVDLKSVCRLSVAAIFIVTVVGCSTAAQGPSASVPIAFPYGTWTTTITADDLAAVSDDQLTNLGMSRSNLIKENAGTFTMTLAEDGTWSTVQATTEQVRWPVFRGSFTAAGADGFDEVTSFPPDFAGDVVRYSWRTENGLLLLSIPNPPDPILKVVTEAHSWSSAD